MKITQPQDVHRYFGMAFNSGDLDALMSMYEPGAVLAPEPGSAQTVTGAEAIRAGLQQLLALHGKMEAATIACLETGDIALTSANWRLRGTGPDGKPIEMSGRSVEVLRRQSDGCWRLVIDHPFGAGCSAAPGQ